MHYNQKTKLVINFAFTNLNLQVPVEVVRWAIGRDMHDSQLGRTVVAVGKGELSRFGQFMIDVFFYLWLMYFWCPWAGIILTKS